jgi:hypothetical protein
VLTIDCPPSYPKIFFCAKTPFCINENLHGFQLEERKKNLKKWNHKFREIRLHCIFFPFKFIFFLRQNKRKQNGGLIRKLGVTSSTKKLFVEITFLHSPVSYTNMVTYEYSHNNKSHNTFGILITKNYFLYWFYSLQ